MTFTVICGFCGSEIETEYADQLYCNGKCKENAKYKRRRIREGHEYNSKPLTLSDDYRGEANHHQLELGLVDTQMLRIGEWGRGGE